MNAAPRKLRAIPLRIDIDYHVGLTRAVPAMLEALAARRMHASFFVVAGVNRPSASIRRLLDRNYRRRLARLGPVRVWNALREDGLFESPGMLDDGIARENLRRIECEGHELVVHGFDHAWWADAVWSTTFERLKHEIDRAFASIDRVAGPRRRAWGSPNWRTREDVQQALIDRGVPYLSECWGRGPFRTRGTLHLPVTDCLEPWYFDRAQDGVEDVVRAMLRARRSDDYRLVCAHDYFEGLMVPELFPALLDGLIEFGFQARPLASVAVQLEAGSWIDESLRRGPLNGFCGEVSWQTSADRDMVSSAPL